MNILILGNGFDLAHGLKTKYSDFLEYCCKQFNIFPTYKPTDRFYNNLWVRHFLSVQQGIAAHGHIGNGTIPTTTDVRIFASTFFHYMEIIFAILDKAEINTNYTNIKFEKIDEIPKYNYVNQYIDNNVNVEYDNGTLFINGAEFRPSEILYNLERVTYDAYIKNV